MLRSLKSKFVLAFGSLVVVLFVATGLFLLDAKKAELSSDIANGTQAFAQFTAENFFEAYDENMAVGNFIPFRREVEGILRNESDISSVRISNYSGVILYDSEFEELEKYSGPVRTINKPEILNRVQANNYSLLMDDGRVVYVMVYEDGSRSYVDANENEISSPGDKERIVNIVVPGNEKAVFYEVGYESMETRLYKAQMQILIVAFLGLILTLMISFMLSTSITNPLKALKFGAQKIAKGDFSTRVDVKTKDELGVLAGTFNKMAEELSVATEAKIDRERMKKELELAAQIQSDLLPKEELILDTLDFAGGLVPASEIGGDAFDYIEMDSGRYLVYLGDVTGHGVPAGIVSSIANALLYGARGKTDLQEILFNLNDVVMNKTTAKVFMTMALALWDEKESTAYYVNAGHPAVLYYDSARNRLTDIKIQGMALGMTDKLETQMQKIKMNPNDVLVMFSDGVPEALNEKGMQYGMQRLKRIVQDAAGDLYTAKGIKNAVLTDVIEHIGEREYTDDMTVVVLKRKQS